MSRPNTPHRRIPLDVSLLNDDQLNLSVSPGASLSLSPWQVSPLHTGSDGEGRQRWISRPHAREPEQASKPVRVPLYMVVLDLAFAANIEVCTYGLKMSDNEDDDQALRFFATFIPMLWLWDHTNSLFNRFDQEDLVSEIVVFVLMGGAMALALNIRACFFADLMPIPQPADSSCKFAAAAYGSSRAVLTLLTLYVALFVPHARRLLRREAVLWLFLAPAMFLLARCACMHVLLLARCACMLVLLLARCACMHVLLLARCACMCAHTHAHAHTHIHLLLLGSRP